MKSLIIILALTTCLILGSCTEIADYRDNYSKAALKKVIFSKADTLSNISFDTIKLGIIKKPRIKFFDVVLRNNSIDMPVTIYSLAPDTSSKLEFVHPVPLPVVLQPGQTNQAEPVQFNLNTALVPSGDYNFKIYINESETCFVTVIATINN